MVYNSLYCLRSLETFVPLEFFIDIMTAVNQMH